ncbi:MAG: Fic family protein [Endomicrobium sp.]|jgi:Fic family protein|nr:Fic family protein [Endomicrobium sp.]
MSSKTVAEMAQILRLTERAVRKYCSQGKIDCIKKGHSYLISEDALPHERKNAKKFSDNNLLNILKNEKDAKIKGRIYHKVQVDLTYNSNHIEGSKLTKDQTRFIFETNTIGIDTSGIPVDDIVETVNHFCCIDFIIDNAKKPLTESIIKNLHKILKTGTSQARQKWFKIGDYKLKANEVGGQETCNPKDVPKKIKELLTKYVAKQKKTIEDIIEFHQKFEKIHPFQDGNGRVGRLVMFKECLANNIVPFIILEQHRWYYYQGLKEWETQKERLIDTCLSAQDKFKEWLKYFKIKV